MIRLRINKNVIATGQMQSEQAMVFRRLYSKSLTVKLSFLRDVRRRESTESFAVLQHDHFPHCIIRPKSRFWFPNARTSAKLHVASDLAMNSYLIRVFLFFIILASAQARPIALVGGRLIDGFGGHPL